MRRQAISMKNLTLISILIVILINEIRSQSINSPRRQSSNDNNNQSKEEEDGGKKEVLVKLPDDLEAVLNMQKSDRSRIHASILGLNPDNTHLDEILEHDATSSSTTVASTTVASTTTSTSRRPRPTRRPYNNKKQDINREQLPKTGRNNFWSIAWEAHVYFSGTLFVLLALYCSVNIMRLHTFSRLFSRGYFVALNLCLIIVGILRPIYLFHDPYNFGESFPKYAAYLLLDTGLPCISTAFAILFLALLRATQIELVSPGFQNPKSLGIFCAVHFAISIGVDIAIGIVIQVRYLILLCQGFFIVWSLLLSAGYFYIFSSMKKISLRNHDDLMRSVCPKLAMDPNSFGHQYQVPQPHQAQNLNSHRPPLARAVHLTLGVAILGSLMGGVQLFGMIKMLGLQKGDMTNKHNELAWFGYQVSMRILEVVTCTLLAVIATTPLRSDLSTPQNGHVGIPRRRSKSNLCWNTLCCCCRESNPPRELEDEIYSEICSTNQSVRQMHLVGQAANGGHQFMGQRDLNNPYGTLGGRMTMQNQPQVIRMGPISDNGQLMNGMVMMGDGTTVNSLGSSSSNPNSTLRSGLIQDPNRTSVASSRATLDTALYSNMRSRPSSMLFNDSGFVRFRANGDPNINQEEVLQQSTQDLASIDDLNLNSKAVMKTKEGLKGSQSFDDSVLLVEQQLEVNKLSPSSQPDESALKSRQQNSASPIYKSIEAEAIYEPPPGMNLDLERNRQIQNQNPYSESDLESTQQIYNRPVSRCSSISATQSFDMRMYGRSKPNQGMSQTLNRKEEKLENPFYYYGSTRKQQRHHQINQKPKPLLPSQRLQLEAQQRSGLLGSNSSQNNSRPNSRQALLSQEQQNSNGGGVEAFVRSRSLGGYYNNNRRTDDIPSPPPPPVRNQQQVFRTQAMAGSMTPLSYSRWQHAQRQESMPKRYNPLYDTPPTARHNKMKNPAQNSFTTRAQLRLDQSGSPHFRLIESPRNFVQRQEPIPAMRNPPQFHEIRGVFQPKPQPRKQSNSILSPVLTDSSSTRGYEGEEEDLDDELSDDDLETNFDDQFTSQATQGYVDGLADNESEMSSNPKQKNLRSQQRFNSSHDNPEKKLSPLEYSAMLKLYSQDERFDDNLRSNAQEPVNADHHNSQLSSSSSSLNQDEMPLVASRHQDQHKNRRAASEMKDKKLWHKNNSKLLSSTTTSDEENSSNYEEESNNERTAGAMSSSQNRDKYQQISDKNESAQAFRWNGTKIESPLSENDRS